MSGRRGPNILRCLVMLATLALAGGVAQAADRRLAVPDAEAQRKASKLIEEVYRPEILKARKPEDKTAIARKMLQAGRETKDDAAGQYVLLVQARELAVQTPHVATALEAVGLISKRYQVDPLGGMYSALLALSANSHVAADQKTIVATGAQAFEEALDAHRFEIARQLSELILTASRKAEDPALPPLALARTRLIREIESAVPNVERARGVLEKTPGNPEANYVLGQFHCLLLGEWDKGLPMLAAGTDPQLRDLAGRDKGRPTRLADRVGLADDWWGLSEKETGAGKRQLQLRAAYWYQAALPQLQGLAKAKAEKRISDAAGPEAAKTQPAAVAEKIRLVILESVPTGNAVGLAPDGSHLVLTKDRKKAVFRMHVQADAVTLELQGHLELFVTDLGEDVVARKVDDKSDAYRRAVSFRLVPSVSKDPEDEKCFSFEGVDRPQHYLILDHSDVRMRSVQGATSRKQATFRLIDVQEK